MNPFADIALAQRLESLAAEEMRRFVRTARSLDPFSEAAYLDVAGGVAAFLGEGSPVNQAVGVGLDGPVGETDVEAIEEFFGSRSQRGLVVLSPLVHRSAIPALTRRSWALDSFENVLVLPLDAYRAERETAPPQLHIVEVTDDERRDLWAHVAAIGFSAPLEPLSEQLSLGRIVSHRAGTRLLLAYVDGRPAGTGEVFCDAGVAWLSADATLPQFRRRGVQSALQRARLDIGLREGCELAVSEAIPGSPSQRNMERLGFRVAYTRVDVVAPMLRAANPGRQGARREAGE